MTLLIVLMSVLIFAGPLFTWILIRKQQVGSTRRAQLSPSAGNVIDAGVVRQSQSPTDAEPARANALVLPPGEAAMIPTQDPRRYLVIGSTQDLDAFGETEAVVPRSLLNKAVGLDGVAQAGRGAVELSGRLVLVDGATARAIRSGTMMKDAAGATVAVRLGEGGKFAGISRLQGVGGVAASGAAIAAGLSGIALQAQLARLEKAVGRVADNVKELGWVVTSQRRADLDATRHVLEEAYRLSSRAGRLDPVVWRQVELLGHRVVSQQRFASDAVTHATQALEAARHSNVDGRAGALNDVRQRLTSALAELADTNRQFLQFQALRIWFLADEANPMLGAHVEELERVLANQPDLTEFADSLLLRIRQMEGMTTPERLRNPFAKDRLARASRSLLTSVEKTDWGALQMSLTGTDAIPVATTPPDLSDGPPSGLAGTGVDFDVSTLDVDGT